MQNNGEKKKKRERSVAYPSHPLESVIEFTSTLREALGKGPYSRDEMAVALGYSGISGVSATKISAMVHFGLLDRTGNVYSQSELAERINHPISDEDKKNAIIEAVSMPKLYKELILDFSGQALPTQLGNLLIRKGISAKISNNVADNFRKSLEFSGHLKNGVVLNSPDRPNEKTNGEEKTISEIAPDSFSPSASLSKDASQKYAFNDSGNGWALIIKSTHPITPEIKKQLIDITELLERSKTINT